MEINGYCSYILFIFGLITGNLYFFVMSKTISNECYLIEIKLDKCCVNVWRTVEVSSDILLPQLHHVIQAAMGWWDEHLHQFMLNKVLYMSKQDVKENENLGMSRVEMVAYEKVRLSDLLPKKGAQLKYEYDLGDSWFHTITLLEHRVYAEGESHQPKLIAGENACPPEDCGGIWGYQGVVEAAKHKQSERYKELKDWLGVDFDPYLFDKDEAMLAVQNSLS